MGVEEPRGWRIIQFDRSKTPPEAVAAAVYLIAAVIIAFTIVVGLTTFVAVGIAAMSTAVTAVASGSWGSSGVQLVTVFFTAIAALIGGPIVIWRTYTSHVQAEAARYWPDSNSLETG